MLTLVGASVALNRTCACVSLQARFRHDADVMHTRISDITQLGCMRYPHPLQAPPRHDGDTLGPRFERCNGAHLHARGRGGVRARLAHGQGRVSASVRLANTYYEMTYKKEGRALFLSVHGRVQNVN